MKHQLLSILTLTLLTAGGGMMALASDSGSIGRRFHRETSFNNMGLVGDNPQWGPRTPLYKTYETADKVKLPSPVVPGMTLDEVIQRRRSIRSFSTAPMTLGQLTGVLYLAAGLTHSVNGYDMRTA
ncbi:MAG: hypothetical protein U9R56_04210, partial [candidate division Zixibacteria bacterium]|nr:hypothetical protein [candidate division Zixibacteria bacterium]